MSFHVVALGDLVADIHCVVPSLPIPPGMLHAVHPIQVEPGGSGNFLITAVRLGLRATALGALGIDALGDLVDAMLRAEGVDMRFVRRPPGSTTTAVLVLVGEGGAHALIGAFGHMPPLRWDPSWTTLFREKPLVFASGYALVEPAFREIGLPLLQKAREHGCPIFFDVGPMGSQVPPKDLRSALAFANVILLTEEEAHASGLDPNRILQEGPMAVVLKRGAAGCQVFTLTDQMDVPGFPVPVVDPVGAGDSFAAGLAYAMLKGWPMAWAAVFANAVGAAKVQRRGTGRQMPTRLEIRRILENHRPDFPYLEELTG